MAKVFETQRLVRHGHTDPAGIVFYPRYFEMINETVEDFFREALGRPFGQMHLRNGLGVPTVHIETSFLAPSYCDDVLTFSLRVTRLGRSSATFDIAAVGNGERRLNASLTIAQVSMKTMKSVPFDDSLRNDLSAYLAAEARERDS